MEDEQLFFEMDLEEWNHGIERYNSNFEELYPCILNARLDGAADHTQNDSEHNYLRGQNPVSSNCAVNAEVAYINDRSNLVTLPLYTAYTDDQDSLLSQNVPQDGQYLLNDDPHRSPRDPMSVDTNHNDDAEQWEIIRRNMTLVQDYVAGAEHPISTSHPEGRRFLDDFDDESGVMPSTGTHIFYARRTTRSIHQTIRFGSAVQPAVVRMLYGYSTPRDAFVRYLRMDEIQHH